MLRLSLLCVNNLVSLSLAAGFTALIFFAVSIPANAQVPTPGSVLQSVDRPVVQPTQAPEQPITREQEEPFTPPTYAKKIQVSQFELIGNLEFDDETLLAEIVDYIDTPITLAQLYAAADRLQQFYRTRGYLLASVYVPAQKISSGTVKLEIIEGRLGGFQIEGELKSYRPDFLVKQLDSLELGEIVRSQKLEHEMLLLNELPGLSARAVIVPGADYGTSDIVIEAAENRSQAVVRLNNYGRKSLGQAQVEAGWLYSNPLFQGDELNLSAIVSEEARMVFGRLDYSALLNTSGTRIAFGISTFEYDVDTQELGLPGLTLEGDGTNIRLHLSQPLVRQQRNRLTVSGGFRNIETNEIGGLLSALRSNDISVFDVWLDWQPTHRGGSTSGLVFTVSSIFRNKTDGLNDEKNQLKAIIDYRYTNFFTQTWFFLIHANLAYASDPLPDAERYRLGGPFNIRAYPSAEVAGDEGGLISLDVGKTFRVFRSTDMIAKIFADSGKVKRLIPVAGEFKDETLSGYGVGLAANVRGQHIIEFEVVKPTSDRISSDGEDPRFWFNYTLTF